MFSLGLFLRAALAVVLDPRIPLLYPILAAQYELIAMKDRGWHGEGGRRQTTAVSVNCRLRAGRVVTNAAYKFSPTSDFFWSANTVTALYLPRMRFELRFGTLSREPAKEKGGNWP